MSNTTPSAEKTNEEKMLELTQALGNAACTAGKLAYNITTYEEDILSEQLKMKNLIVDINKLREKIEKAKIKEASPAKLEMVQGEAVNVVQ